VKIARTADIAIIGGGIIGMSCAYEIARQSDLRVVLFDNSNIAGGTTGGSAGVICLHDMGEIYASLTLLGYERIHHLRREHGFTFNAWGSLDVVYAPRAFPPAPNRYVEYFTRLGLSDLENSIYHSMCLDRDALLARYPWIKPDGVQGGVLYPNQGYVDPYALVTLYERLALATGRVQIHRSTPVLEIRTDGDRIATLITRRGAWTVGQVLNAGGPWGAKIAAMAGSDVADNLIPQRIQVCVATGFEDDLDDVPLTGAPEAVGDEHVWCRGEMGGMLLFGQHHHVTRDGFTVDPDFVNRVNDDHYPAQVADVYRRYWRLPKSVFLNGWCCVYGTTTDGFPILSRDTHLTNFYHALGMNGHGMTCHAGVAQAVSALMLHNHTHISLQSVLGQPITMDFSSLNAGRFARGHRLDFDLREGAFLKT
jgi:glycine/D-amino acid oxidase-like deaminating enzyme